MSIFHPNYSTDIVILLFFSKLVKFLSILLKKDMINFVPSPHKTHLISPNNKIGESLVKNFIFYHDFQ